MIFCFTHRSVIGESLSADGSYCRFPHQTLKEHKSKLEISWFPPLRDQGHGTPFKMQGVTAGKRGDGEHQENMNYWAGLKDNDIESTVPEWVYIRFSAWILYC